MLSTPAAPDVPQPADDWFAPETDEDRREIAAEKRQLETEEAAVPQPVDREALTRMLAETVFHCFDNEEFGLSAKHAVAISDAVADLLAGEQEQVEK